MLNKTAIIIMILGITAQVSAEPTELAVDEGAQVIVTEANESTQVQVVEQEPSAAQQGRGLQYGGSLVFPIWLSEELSSIVNPGVGVAGRVGYEVGHGLSFELSGGITWNGAKSDLADGALLDAFVMVGARYGFLNRTRFVPYLQGGIGLNFWDYCNSSGCSDYSEMTFGARAGGGVAIEINPNAAFELGADLMWTAAGDLFTASQFNISPTAGFTLYY